MKYESNQWHIIFQKSMNIKQTRYDNIIPLFGVCFLVMLCQEPITISNAVHVSNGYQNGSQTLYSCIQGYAGNIGNRITTCNGTHWSNTTLTCGEQKFFLWSETKAHYSTSLLYHWCFIQRRWFWTQCTLMNRMFIAYISTCVYSY